MVAACLVTVAAGCKKNVDAPPAAEAPAGPGPSGGPGPAAAAVAAVVAAKPAAPPAPGSIRPIATGKGLAILVAKAPTWVEGDFACFAAGVTLQPGAHAIDTFEKVKPGIGAAFTAAGLSFDDDIGVIGGLSCPASMCIYATVTLHDLDQPKKLLDKLLPGGVTVAPDGQLVATIAGPKGPREIRVRILPLDWGGVVVPDGERGARVRKNTHVLFVSADDAGKPPVDPLALISSAADGRAQLAKLEALADDPRDRCVEGVLTRSANFRPGFDLEGASFLAATPPRTADDAVAESMSASRGLDLEVALDLSKPATEADVDGWVATARQWFDGIAQTTGSPEIVGLLRVFVESAFAPKLDGKRVILSWKTARVPRARIEQMDADLRAAGYSP